LKRKKNEGKRKKWFYWPLRDSRRKKRTKSLKLLNSKNWLMKKRNKGRKKQLRLEMRKRDKKP